MFSRLPVVKLPMASPWFTSPWRQVSQSHGAVAWCLLSLALPCTPFASLRRPVPLCHTQPCPRPLIPFPDLLCVFIPHRAADNPLARARRTVLCPSHWLPLLLPLCLSAPTLRVRPCLLRVFIPHRAAGNPSARAGRTVSCGCTGCFLRPPPMRPRCLSLPRGSPRSPPPSASACPRTPSPTPLCVCVPLWAARFSPFRAPASPVLPGFLPRTVLTSPIAWLLSPLPRTRSACLFLFLVFFFGGCPWSAPVCLCLFFFLAHRWCPPPLSLLFVVSFFFNFFCTSPRSSPPWLVSFLLPGPWRCLAFPRTRLSVF